MKRVALSLCVITILISGLAPLSTMDAMAGSNTLYGISSPKGAAGGGSGASTLYTINPATGFANPVGAIVLPGPIVLNGCSGMDFFFGTMFATCDRASDGLNVLVTLNLNTGAATLVGVTGIEGAPFAGGQRNISDISFRNSDGTLYGYVEPVDEVATINIATGAATLFPGSSGVSGLGNAIAFSNGDILFNGNRGVTIGALGCAPLLCDINTINQATGMSSLSVQYSGALGALGDPRFAAFDFAPDGTLYGTLFDGRPLANTFLTTVNTGTGAVNIIGATTTGMDALAWAPVGVGGELLPINTTALLLAGIQSSALWLVPLVASAVGIGAFALRKKF